MPTYVWNEMGCQVGLVYNRQLVIGKELANSCKEFKLGYRMRQSEATHLQTLLWMGSHSVLWCCTVLSTLRITKQPSASEPLFHFPPSPFLPSHSSCLIYRSFSLFFSLPTSSPFFFPPPYNLTLPLCLCLFSCLPLSVLLLPPQVNRQLPDSSVFFAVGR